MIKRLKSTTLGCRNYKKHDSIGQSVVKLVEETCNCTTYQIFGNKMREVCNSAGEMCSRKIHKKLGILSEYGIYKQTGFLPHCEHDEVDVKSMDKPIIRTHQAPTSSLEF